MKPTLPTNSTTPIDYDVPKHHDQLNAKLRSQAHILKQLTGNVIHDLLTPMQALEMGVDTMETMTNPRDEDARDLLHSMQGTLSLMSMIVHRCMDVFEASDGSKLKPKCETFDYSRSVSRVGRFMASMQSRISIDLRFMRGVNRTEVHTDKSWFEDNILCMLSNAVKFSKDVPDVKVELKVFPSKNIDSTGLLRRMLTVEVWDTGVNMADDTRQKLFDMPDMEGRNQMGGAGLGLFSMAKRVEALDGLVGSRDRGDDVCPGSVFWFTVPCDSRGESGLGLRQSVDGGSSKKSAEFVSLDISKKNCDQDGDSDEDGEVDDDDYYDSDYDSDETESGRLEPVVFVNGVSEAPSLTAVTHQLHLQTTAMLQSNSYNRASSVLKKSFIKSMGAETSFRESGRSAAENGDFLSQIRVISGETKVRFCF